MNLFVKFSLILALSFLDTAMSGCIYNESGTCIQECPPDTVSYTSACRETMSQRTCKEPIARSMGVICDLSRCDCVEPKVWDEVAGKCVMLEDCSKADSKDEIDCKSR